MPDPGMVPNPPYMLDRAYTTGGGPLGLEVMAELQAVANAAAAGTLVARALFPVEYKDDVVPIAMTADVTATTTRTQAGANQQEGTGVEVGKLLTAQFRISEATLSAMLQGRHTVDLSDLTRAARQLAVAETSAVFSALVAWVRRHRKGSDSTENGDAQDAARLDAGKLLQTVAKLRGAGYLGALALALTPDAHAEVYASLVDPDQGKVFDRVEKMLDMRLYAMPLEGSEPRPRGVVAEAGAARIVIGDNFTLRWVSTTGTEHTIQLSVGVLTLVTDPDAVLVLA